MKWIFHYIFGCIMSMIMVCAFVPRDYFLNWHIWIGTVLMFGCVSVALKYNIEKITELENEINKLKNKDDVVNSNS